MSVLIYLKPTCSYCKKALLVLRRRGAQIMQIDISNNPNRRAEMIQKANGNSTVPQIFIKDQYIGGCDVLVKLDKSGQLEKML